ncbi:MAG: type IV pilus assembly protein PilM [Armatimonadota bacterium]
MAARRGVKLKDHTVLALDIGTRFIKVAEMRLTRGIVSLVNVAMCPTPPGVMDNSQILDPVGLGRAIKQLVNANKFKTRKVVLSISGQSSVVVRPIDLPKMTRKELADTMKFEVERHIPFTADQVIMDYAPFVDAEDLPETESNMKVLLAVAQEELINAYLKVIATAGLTPAAMDVEILASIRALVDILLEEEDYNQTVALVNIGASTTDISVVDNGTLSFTRTVPIAGDTLTEAISDQLGRSFEEAEELKKEHGCIYLDAVFSGELSAPQPMEAAAPESVPESPGGENVSFFDAYDTLQTPAPAADTPGSAAPQNIFSLDEDFSTPGPVTLESAAPELETLPAPPPSDQFTTPIAPFQMDDDVDDEVLTPFTLGMEPLDSGAPLLRLDQEVEETKPGSQVFDLDDKVDDEPAAPFMLHPGDAAAAPPLQLDQGAPESAPAQVFSLDDAVDDERMTPFLLHPEEIGEAPVLRLGQAESTPAPAQVFDLDDVDDEVPTPVSLNFAADVPQQAAAAPPESAGAAPLFDLSSELREQMPPPLSRPGGGQPVGGAVTPVSPMFQEEPIPTVDNAPELVDVGAVMPPAYAMDEPTPPAPETAIPLEPAVDVSPSLEATAFEPTMTLESVPAFERPDMPQGEVFQRRIFESMLPALGELVTEIRRSLEYYSSREPDTPVQRILLYGGTSRMPNLAEFIRQEVGVEVVAADPLRMLDIAPVRLPEEYLQELAPALPICIGLGLRDMIA